MKPVQIQAFRTNHSLIKISGPGSRDFLQGQLSADMADLDYEEGAEGAFRWTSSLLLGPDGKLVAMVRVLRPSESMLGIFENEYVIETQPGFGEQVLDRFQRFSIGANCEMQLGKCHGVAVIRNSEEDLILVDGENSDEALEGKYPRMEETWSKNTVCIQLLGTKPEMKLLAYPDTEVPFYPETDFEFWRILNGIPKMGNELYEGMIPSMAGQKFIDRNVSFTKGCFVGQELVARMDSRGAEAPKKLQGIAVDSLDEALIPETKDFDGEITSFALVPSNIGEISGELSDAYAIGMAYMKRKFESERAVVSIPQNYRDALKGDALKARVRDLS